MINAAPKFYTPKSPTGRMSHSKPAIQMLPSPGAVKWQKLLEDSRKLQKQSNLTGKIFEVARQVQMITRGDLVVWEPTGKPGLWLVANVNYFRGPGKFGDNYFRGPGKFGDVDYSSPEKRMADKLGNPCGEVALSDSGKTVLREKYVRRSIAPGKIRLEWFAGWAGYSNDRCPVVVNINEIRLPNEMEAIALAAL